MTKITVEIINYIKRKKEGELKNWYAGITNDLTERKKSMKEKKILYANIYQDGFVKQKMKQGK